MFLRYKYSITLSVHYFLKTKGRSRRCNFAPWDRGQCPNGPLFHAVPGCCKCFQQCQIAPKFPNSRSPSYPGPRSSMPAPSNPFTPVTSPPDPRPLMTTLQASYHRTLRGLRVRGDDPNAPPSPHLRGRAGRGRLSLGQTLPPRPDDGGDHPVSGTQQGAPGSPTPPIDPAEQLLPRSLRTDLSQLRSGHCSRLQAYRHSVGWADDPTCPDCRSTDHTVALLFSYPTHLTDLTPGDMWTAPLQVAQLMAGLPPPPSVACPTAGRLWLLPSLTLIPAVGRLIPDHQRDHIILTSPFTPISSFPWSGGRLPPPPSNNIRHCWKHLQYPGTAWNNAPRGHCPLSQREKLHRLDRP